MWNTYECLYTTVMIKFKIPIYPSSYHEILGAMQLWDRLLYDSNITYFTAEEQILEQTLP